MKIMRLEANYDKVKHYKLSFDKDNGVTPEYPNTVDESGCDVAVGKVNNSAKFMHHIDRGEVRYLIYINGSMGKHVDVVPNLEKALDIFLENS